MVHNTQLILTATANDWVIEDFPYIQTSVLSRVYIITTVHV